MSRNGYTVPSPSLSYRSHHCRLPRYFWSVFELFFSTRCWDQLCCRWDMTAVCVWGGGGCMRACVGVCMCDVKWRSAGLTSNTMCISLYAVQCETGLKLRTCQATPAHNSQTYSACIPMYVRTSCAHIRAVLPLSDCMSVSVCAHVCVCVCVCVHDMYPHTVRTSTVRLFLHDICSRCQRCLVSPTAVQPINVAGTNCPTLHIS